MNEEYLRYREGGKGKRRRKRKEWGPLGGIDDESRAQTRRIHKGLFIDTYQVSYFGYRSHSYRRYPSALTHILFGVAFVTSVILIFLSF